MSTAIDAIYENGVFKPEHPLALKDKTRVHLVVEPAADSTQDDDPTGWKTARELIGCIEGAPADLTENHDAYLYGK